MKESTKTGLEIIQVAVGIGVLGDILLRVTPWGLNVLLFNVAFAAGMITLLWRRAPEKLTRQTLALLGALIFFASMFVWRDSIELRIADSIAILAVLAVLFVPRMNVTAKLAGVFHYAVGFLWSSFNAMFAPVVLISSDIDWKFLPREGWRKHAFSAFRGVAIVTPLLLIFGALFMAADAAFEGLVQRVFNFDPTTIFTHFLLFGIFAWLSAGYLRGVLLRTANPLEAFVNLQTPVSVTPKDDKSPVDRVRDESGEYPVRLPNDRFVVDHLNISDSPNASDEPKPEETKPNEPKKWDWAKFDNSVFPSSLTLGTVEVGVILGLMNLLFLSFVIVQVPYLFGGMELVQNTPDFKLAEYARRGFGELVAVSALVLPILLVGHWLIRKENPFTEKLFRVFAAIQIGLLFVIMASAVQRLFLLTGNLGYGMTTIRLYPMIFMLWLAIVFVWFGSTVLRGARQHFAWGALWSAFFILGATHVLNPDEFIGRHNLALMREGREFDAAYNSTLSDDALPTLISSFDSLAEQDQQIAIRQIAGRFCEMRKEADLRSWNLARWQAARLLNSDTAFVKELKSSDVCLVGYSRHDDF